MSIAPNNQQPINTHDQLKRKSKAEEQSKNPFNNQFSDSRMDPQYANRFTPADNSIFLFHGKYPEKA